MSENKFKIVTPAQNQSSSGTIANPVKGPISNGTSVFSGLEKRLKLESYFEEGFPVQYLPKILFVMALGLLYIGNTHYSEKTVRKINNIQSEVEDLRADYTTMKSDLM